LIDEKDGAKKYQSFVNSSNYEREHRGINGMTPAEKFKTADTGTLKQDKKCQPCWYIILSTMSGMSSWILTAYLVSGAVTTPIAGKLSDRIGFCLSLWQSIQ
jgi:MFS family permease